MRCPKDVRPEDFKELLSGLPDGYRLRKSRARLVTGIKMFRDFYFDITKPTLRKQGDTVVYSLACKIERRV